MYLCLYTANIYNEIFQKEETEHGILYVENFIDAAQKIEDLYKNDCDKVTFELFDVPVFSFSDKDYNTIRDLIVSQII